MNDVELKAYITQTAIAEYFKKTGTLMVPVNVSNRHIHLDSYAVEVLFGKGYKLTKQKDLMQPGQFACKETVTIRGPKGFIPNVRILGPERNATQVEISKSDSFKLGVSPMIRMSGDIDNTPGIILEGPAGKLGIKKGVIVARRHLHVPAQYAALFGLDNGSTVSLVSMDERRPSVLLEVAVRISDKFLLESHVDMDEANGCGISNGDLCRVYKEGSFKG